MTKKIRLIDDESTNATAVAGTGGGVITAEDIAQFLKYAEAIDWKLWELLKLERAKTEGETNS